MKCWGIEWPAGWVAYYSGDGRKYNTYVTRADNKAPRVMVYRYRAAAVRKESLPGEYQAVVAGDAGNNWSRRALGIFKTPEEALAACLFYDGR